MIVPPESDRAARGEECTQTSRSALGRRSEERNMLMEKERRLVAEYGRKMSRAGLSRGTAGNLSIYDPSHGYLAISPSGLDYFETEAEDVVVCDPDGRVVEGSRKPSSEYGLHAAFYRQREGCLAVIHTHSDYATTLACMDEPLRAVHFTIATLGTHEIPVAPYATFGTPELAKLAADACGTGRAVLLAHHGAVTFAESIEAAFRQAEELEALAKTQWQCMCAGRLNVLTKAQIDAARLRLQTYGQT